MKKIEDIVMSRLPRGKLQWLKVLLNHRMLKAEAVLLVQSAKDAGALLDELKKQFPSLNVAMAEVCLLVATVRRYIP